MQAENTNVKMRSTRRNTRKNIHKQTGKCTENRASMSSENELTIHEHQRGETTLSDYFYGHLGAAEQLTEHVLLYHHLLANNKLKFAVNLHKEELQE